MNKIDDGGSVHPYAEKITSYVDPGGGLDVITTTVENTGHPGMTLLDYFASGASEGDIKTYRKPKEDYAGNQFRERTRVEARYAYATAMIAEKRRLENIDA